MSAQSSKDIVVPPMGESITEATIARWLKQKGEPVKLDEPLVELETDKVTLEVSSPAVGVLSEQLAPQGASVNVGAIIGRVTGEGVASKGASPSPKQAPQDEEEIPLSPSVRKLVAENQIDPRRIEGKGKEGRLTKGDVLTLLDKEKVEEEVVEKSVKPNDHRVERVRMSRLRQRIAERLKEAQNTAAILTTFNEVDMTNVMNLRAGLKDSFEKKHGVKLGFMSFFVKSCLVALKEIPAVNAEIEGDEIIYKNYYDIGIAVGTSQGLVVPVVRDANKKSFAQIEKDIADLGQKARDGKLSMQELQGGTFTITNGGVYGSLMATPILNPPQSGILGMHKIQERPVVINGKVEIRPMMYLALSYDHRIIDGKEAVTFLVRVKECLENPERILLDV
ncbi:2-oxoglutarate dehydrogenase complex dihydrolipoyllysine-residue succinyltransferase [Kamptonema cortianum]|jgi:2-oxoglutarate dehydrogenase E2 component (dihydrolipoamide succinyltransferase)|nr:2-oxoglutarate dehydrogenase complex dihydrolipoyllysine-residue succinyltransferase [Kamptonema cortianum]